MPARFLSLWNSLSKNTGVSCHFLLQVIFLTQGLNPCLLNWQADSLPLSHLGSPHLELHSIFKTLKPNNDHHNKHNSGSYRMGSQSMFSGLTCSLGPSLLILLLLLTRRLFQMIHIGKWGGLGLQPRFLSCNWAEITRAEGWCEEQMWKYGQAFPLGLAWGGCSGFNLSFSLFLRNGLNAVTGSKQNCERGEVSIFLSIFLSFGAPIFPGGGDIKQCILHWHISYMCPTLCDPMNCSPPGSSVHGNSPIKNTGVGCHALPQSIIPTQGLNQCFLYLLHCRQLFYPLSHLGSLDGLYIWQR